MSGEGGMTLAFELDALYRLADPEVAVRESDAWAASVGIVSDTIPDQIPPFADKIDVVPAFIGSVTGKSDGLGVVRQQYLAERHVFVGSTDDDRAAARSLGWEYLDISDAADEAGWSLAAADGRWRSASGDAESISER